MGLRVTARSQDEGQERHHQHAATQPEQTGEEAGAQAQQGQFKYEGEREVHVKSGDAMGCQGPVRRQRWMNHGNRAGIVA